MIAHDLTTALRHFDRRIPMIINERPVVAVEIAGGRLRTDIMYPTFREMPDKARDEAIVMRTGSGPAMTVGDVINVFMRHDQLCVFVFGEPVSGFETAGRALNRSTGLYDPTRGRNGSVTPVHWDEMSTGNQYLSRTWLKPED